MNKKAQIRPITIDDSSSISMLCTELGYVMDHEGLKRQLGVILKDRTQVVYAAEVARQVVGFIHGVESTRLTSKPFTEIVALIVSEPKRNNGIGQLLVEHLESESPNELVRVRCNAKRDVAHLFYNRMEYNEIKEQKVFSKKVS